MEIGDKVIVQWFTVDAGSLDIPGTVYCPPSCTTSGKVGVTLDEPLYNSFGMSMIEVWADVAQVRECST